MVSSYFDTNENQIVFSFTGHMDTFNSLQDQETVTHQLTELKDTGGADSAGLNIVFDLKDVNFIASSFIRTCISTHKFAGSGNFCIKNCAPFIIKTFKIAGLDEILKVS